jgi:ABC-2 type transport system permease protein
MKHLEIKLRRLIGLYKAFFRVNVLKSLEYRTDFVITFIATSSYVLGYILFLDAILRQVPVIAGWKFEHLLILFSINQLIFYLSYGLFRDSLHLLPLDIKNGDIDKLLKLPVPIKFVASIRAQSFDFILPALVAVSIFFYSIRQMTIDFWQWFLFGFLFLIGLTIYYFLVHIVIVLSFWIIESEDLVGILEELTDYSRYPMAFFPRPLSAFFIFVVPLLLVVYVPMTVLSPNLFDWKLATISLVMCVILKYVSDFLWRKALQHYSGVSS